MTAPDSPLNGWHGWSGQIRLLLSFGLGIALIIVAITRQGTDATLLIIGLLLMGIVPIDAILSRFGWGKKNGNSGGSS